MLGGNERPRNVPSVRSYGRSVQARVNLPVKNEDKTPVFALGETIIAACI